MSLQRGVTMMELMVTLSIAAILLTIAAPSMRDFIIDNRVAGASNQLMASFAFARSEAIRRGVTVTLCKSANGATCANAGGWEQGWIIFPDGGVQGTVDGGDAPIRVVEAFTNLTISGGANFTNWFSYLSNGASDGAALNNGTFSVCSSPSGRDIVINDTGRVRVSAVAC